MQRLQAVFDHVESLVRKFLQAVFSQVQTPHWLPAQKNIRGDLRDLVSTQVELRQIFQVVENLWLQSSDFVERHVQDLKLSKVPGEDV